MKTFKEYLAEAEDLNPYQEFFKKMLNKWKVKSPSELSDDQISDFFNEVSEGWKKEKNK